MKVETKQRMSRRDKRMFNDMHFFSQKNLIAKLGLSADTNAKARNAIATNILMNRFADYDFLRGSIKIKIANDSHIVRFTHKLNVPSLSQVTFKDASHVAELFFGVELNDYLANKKLREYFEENEIEYARAGRCFGVFKSPYTKVSVHIAWVLPKIKQVTWDIGGNVVENNS